MLISPAFQTILTPTTPRVKLLDVVSDATDLTTYTFTAANIGDFGGTASDAGFTIVNSVYVRASSKKYIVACVHGQDSATVFTVSSCTIGGVAGTKKSDRGGSTNAINTAFFYWDTAALDKISNTDVVVTWSEAITGCTVGLLEVENVGVLDAGAGTASATSTGNIQVSLTGSITATDRYPVAIVASTIDNTAETFQVTSLSSGGLGNKSWTILYEGNNGEFGYAAAWTYYSGYPAENGVATALVTWSGSGAGDASMFGIA